MRRDLIARYINQASGSADVRFGPQLLVTSSAMSERDEPHSFVDPSDGLTEHAWEIIPLTQ